MGGSGKIKYPERFIFKMRTVESVCDLDSCMCWRREGRKEGDMLMVV